MKVCYVLELEGEDIKIYSSVESAQKELQRVCERIEKFMKFMRDKVDLVGQMNDNMNKKTGETFVDAVGCIKKMEILD